MTIVEGNIVPEKTALTSKDFRQTMALFGTGVTVMAVETPDGEIVGMTANAFTSVSLEPMLVLVCVGKKANIAPAVLEAEGFSLSILSEDQEDLSNFFAGIWDKEKTPPPDFEFDAWHGAPRLKGAIGAIGCHVYDIHEGGDHWIVIGEVVGLH